MWASCHARCGICPSAPPSLLDSTVPYVLQSVNTHAIAGDMRAAARRSRGRALRAGAGGCPLDSGRRSPASERTGRRPCPRRSGSPMTTLRHGGWGSASSPMPRGSPATLPPTPLGGGPWPRPSRPSGPVPAPGVRDHGLHPLSLGLALFRRLLTTPPAASAASAPAPPRSKLRTPPTTRKGRGLAP